MLTKNLWFGPTIAQVPAGAPTVVAAVDYPEQLVGHLVLALAVSRSVFSQHLREEIRSIYFSLELEYKT